MSWPLAAPLPVALAQFCRLASRLAGWREKKQTWATKIQKSKHLSVCFHLSLALSRTHSTKPAKPKATAEPRQSTMSTSAQLTANSTMSSAHPPPTTAAVFSSGLGQAGPKSLGRGDLASPGKNVIYGIGSVILPPVAVFVKTGDFGETLVNTLLWLCGYFPGLIHSLIVTQSDTRAGPCMGCSPKLAMDAPPGAQIEQLTTRAMETPAHPKSS